MTPDAVKRLTDSGFEVWVEKGAGLGASCTDTDYTNAGAKIAPSHQKLFAGAEIILKVNPPKDEKGRHEIDDYPSGSVLISFLEIMKQPELAAKLAKKGITALAMETLPRITRAQSMDALSSQASAAGYKAVLWAAKESKKFFPMLTTAAGTIRPAKVFVIGAGVAGLQAIATAHRLGAVVEAFDIRPAAKIEVESLGAKFVQANWKKRPKPAAAMQKRSRKAVRSGSNRLSMTMLRRRMWSSLRQSARQRAPRLSPAHDRSDETRQRGVGHGRRPGR
jgi:NAD(P) transhydrogenase subunit alpha